MFILSGGEPLLRDDLEAIAAHATRRRRNGGRRHQRHRPDGGAHRLAAGGRRHRRRGVGRLASERYHDRFRHGGGALADTLAAVGRLGEARLDFLVQTTVTRGNRGELRDIAAWAAEAGAVCFNVYFLVETGRGEGMHGLRRRRTRRCSRSSSSSAAPTAAG